MSIISIIVPVYNREKYIEKCLQSLATQGVANLEIIVVDNNSTDGTAKIVKKFARQHECVQYYSCKKQGVSAARNYGIEKATGEYISFVDSDDYCKPNMYEALLNEAERSGADIIICGVETQNKARGTVPRKNQSSDYKGANPIKKALCLPAAVYGKLIKRSLLDKHKIRFDEELSLAEDLTFISTAIAYADGISFVDEDYYVYVEQSDNSLMLQSNSEREYQLFRALGRVYGVYKKGAGTLDKYYAEVERIFIANLVLAASTRYMLPTGDKAFYEQALQFLRGHFPKWHKNPYYQKRGAKMKVFFFLYRHGMIMPLRKLISRAKS